MLIDRWWFHTNLRGSGDLARGEFTRKWFEVNVPYHSFILLMLHGLLHIISSLTQTLNGLINNLALQTGIDNLSVDGQTISMRITQVCI